MILDSPVKLADKILASDWMVGAPITVSTSQIETGPPVFQITATCGESVETQRHTFGNADGTGPDPSTMQTWLDAARQQTADASAWDEHVRTAVPNLV